MRDHHYHQSPRGLSVVYLSHDFSRALPFQEVDEVGHHGEDPSVSFV